MDQVITIAIILVLLAIIIGSLRRGIQSLISFALLGLLITFLFARLPGRGMSFAFGLFGGGDETDDAPITAIKAFDEFSQASSSFVPNLISSGLGTNNGTANGTNNGTAAGNGTDVTPTNPGNGASGNAGNTGNTNTGNTNNTGTDGTGSNGTGTGNATGNDSSQGTSEESGSTGSVRAWW